MKSKCTQLEMIRTHLVRHGSITPREALDLYGCFRLGARIWDLKKKGNIIVSESITVGDKTYAKYSFVKCENSQICLL